MSNLVFPTLAGQDIAIKRTPVFSTVVQTAASGKELRASYQGTPRWRYEIPLKFARVTGFSTNTITNEMAAILGLFNAVKGKWDSFLYTDPYSNTAANTPFGTGNGSTTAFQLLDIEGFPIFDLNGTPTITRTDWQGTQTLYATPRTNLCPYSQAFNSWQVNGTPTVTPDSTTDPLGTSTADTVTGASGSNPFIYVAPTIANGTVCRFSVWAKNVNSLQSAMYVRSGVTAGYIYINWSGTTPASLTSGGNATNATFQDFGNGWYRISFTLTTTETNQNFRLYPTFNTDGASCYFWGAQIEAGSTTTSYIPTTTAPVTVTDYTLSSTGMVTLGQVPVAGAALAWSGNYYRRVRFDMDEYEQEQMLNLCWNGGTIKLISVK
jgi:hypothetical protein